MLSIMLYGDGTFPLRVVESAVESLDGVRLFGSTRDQAQVLEACRSGVLDLVVIDTNDSSDLVELVKTLRTVKPDLRIIALFDEPGHPSLTALVKEGVEGYLLKTASQDLFRHALLGCLEGLAMMDEAILADLIEGWSGSLLDLASPDELARVEQLTEREIEVIRWVAQGYLTSEIADQLFITRKTVRNHISHAMRKLGLENRVQLVLFAYRTGVASADAGEETPF